MPLIALTNTEYREISQYMTKDRQYDFVTTKTIYIEYAATKPPVNTVGTEYQKHSSFDSDTLIFDGELKVWGKSELSKTSVDIYEKNEDVNKLPTGVPSFFNKSVGSGDTFLIQKGALNKLRLRPQIINEHAESSRSIIATVTSTSNCGQIFKASQDNINGLDLALKSASVTSLDDFESYADSAALQAAWVASGTDLALLNESLFAPDTSTKSMEIPGDAVVGDEWVKTVPATDFTGATGTGYFRATHDFSNLKIRFFLSDGTNSKSAQIIQTDINIWQQIQLAEEQLTEDQAGTTDTENITSYGFRLEDRRNNSSFYIDTLVYSPPPGSVSLKLFDMGDTLPVSGTTKLSDGTQYGKLGDLGITGIQVSEILLNLEGGFRNYHINDFVAGVALEIPDNEILTPGNYYALTINYVDTDVSVYGPNPLWDDYYANGYSFTFPDELTAISATGANEDLMFIIYSTQEVYVSGFQTFIDNPPNGNSIASLYVEDMKMRRPSVFITGVKPPQTVTRDLNIPAILEKGGKIELEYNDDFTDSVSQITFIFLYYFEAEDVNG